MGIAKKIAHINLILNCTFHIIVVTEYLHTISFESCSYNPLSKSSLWRILTSIKPSRRKELGGFDNLTVFGINRFETLLKLALKYRFVKTMTEANIQ